MKQMTLFEVGVYCVLAALFALWIWVCVLEADARDRKQRRGRADSIMRRLGVQQAGQLSVDEKRRLRQEVVWLEKYLKL